MNDLRTAAQQALEALEADNSKLWPSEKRTTAITALRAALAEPVQDPVGEVEAIDEDKEEGICHAIVALYNPVNLGDKVYPAPPQRKPLSDADLAKIWDDALDQLDPRDQLRFIARAIERAHGITP